MKKLKRLCTAIFVLNLFGLMNSLQSFASMVDEVRVEGVAADQLETVRAVSGYLPGDDLENAHLMRAEEKLKNYFEGKGYPAAQVVHELKHEPAPKHEVGKSATEKLVLTFKILLGEPIRISGVRYETKEGLISADLVAPLNQVVDLHAGEPFDRDRIRDMKKAIETTLANLNFVDTKVTDITSDRVTNGLLVTFNIDLGQQIVFSVSGNLFFARSELMRVIEDQIRLGLGRDYISMLQGLIRDKYVDNGFRAVKITPYTFEPRGKQARKVVFEIEEGPKTYIRSFIFDGNDVFRDDELEDLFFKNAPDRIQSRIYNQKMVEDSSKAMVEEMKKQGYLSAKLIAIKTEELSSGSEVDLRIFVNEGLQTKVQAIEFHGNHVLSSEKLQEYLGLHEGLPLNLVQLEDGIDRLKKEYRNLGYLDVKIVNESKTDLITYAEKNQYANLNFEIEEGQKLYFSGLKIFGNTTTRSSVIVQEFRLSAGDTLFEDKLLESEDRLRRLGIFTQVKLELIDDPDHAFGKTVKVSVQESTPGRAATGIGLRNDLGVRVFGEVSYANLWGKNHTWVLNLSGNRRFTDYRFVEGSAQISYIWPWFTLGETTFRPSLTAERREYPRIFDAETYAFSANWDRSLYRPLHLSGSFTYTLEQDRQFNAVDTTQNQIVRIGSVTPLLRMDFRDNPLAPKKGFFALTSFEYANSFLGTQVSPIPVSYGRFQVRGDTYFDFIPHVVWYSSIRGGWLKNFANTKNADGTANSAVTVPLIKQFALGGVNSVRGYVDQELNVQANDPNVRVNNYLSYVNYRTQFDFYATQNLSFGPFLDAANLLLNDFSFTQHLYTGTGAGLRYLTPVGPVNFDWGFKLSPQPKPGASSNVFYFSLGVI